VRWSAAADAAGTEGTETDRMRRIAATDAVGSGGGLKKHKNGGER
jgi:hypothetical protein